MTSAPTSSSFSSPPVAKAVRARTVVETLEPRTLLSAAPFLPAVAYRVAPIPVQSTVADFNGDGRPDIAMPIEREDRVAIVLNNGDGTFAPPQYFHAGFPRAIAAADFNGDGHIDLAVTSSSFDFNISGTTDAFGNPIPVPSRGSTLKIFFGNGDGTFVTPAVNYPLFAGGRFVATADVNGDGHPDVVVTTRNRVAVLLNKGDGTFFVPTYYSTGNDHPTSLSIADFNNDGLPDIAVTRGSTNAVTILLNNPSAAGTFGPPAFYPAGANPQALTVGDFNHDGNLDLAVVNSGFRVPAVSVLLGNGNGTFRPAASYNGVRFSDGITSGDYTGDGNTDLVVASFDGPLMLYPGNGDGTFATPVEISGAIFGQVVQTADFNGDNHPDLAVTPFQGLKILLNSGQAVTPTPPGSPVDQTLGAGGQRTFQFYAPDGTLASVSLQGPGTATLHFSSSSTISIPSGRGSRQVTALQLSTITTTGTTVATALSISANLGSRTITLDSISADAPIGSINAGKANLTGTLSLAGGANRVSLLSANNGSILIGGGQMGSLQLGQTNLETINSAVPIGTMRVNLDAGVTLTAPSLGMLSVKGSLHDSVLNLTAPFSATATDLGNLSSNRGMNNVAIHSAGSIGTIAALNMSNSTIGAGVGPLPPGQGLPASAADFSAPATIGSVKLQLPKHNVPSFSNSVIAASGEGNLNLGGIQTVNGGTPFGVAARSISTLSGKIFNTGQSFRLTNLTSASQVAAELAADGLNLQDFVVRVLA